MQHGYNLTHVLFETRERVALLERDHEQVISRQDRTEADVKSLSSRLAVLEGRWRRLALIAAVLVTGIASNLDIQTTRALVLGLVKFLG